MDANIITEMMDEMDNDKAAIAALLGISLTIVSSVNPRARQLIKDNLKLQIDTFLNDPDTFLQSTGSSYEIGQKIFEIYQNFLGTIETIENNQT